MRRYIRLYVCFVRFSFSRAMEFRVDFFFRIVMDCAYYLVNFLFFKIIYLHSEILGGWTESQVMIFVGGFIVVDALNMTLFSNNTWMLPIFVNRGDLDYYLVRPVSAFFFLSLRDFAANSFVNLMLAAGLLATMLVAYDEPLEPASILLFVMLLVNGTVLYHLMHMLTILPAFWMHSARGLEGLFWSLGRCMERPDRIFTGWVRRVLLTVLPFSVMASLPAQALLSENPWPVAGYCLAVTAVLSAVMALLWRWALRCYSSASS